MRRPVIVALLALVATPAAALELKSADVSDGAAIGPKFVCATQGGSGISPALSWSGAPADAKSFAVTIFDPDAPSGGFWHWQAIDIPAGTSELTQGAGAPGPLPHGATSRPNSAGHPYDAPCPPPGPAHHYRITLYALPTATLAIPPDTGPGGVGALLKRTALATAEMVPVLER
jgi:Raf kinase inhibitor-like YbhB/YbcL family protein